MDELQLIPFLSQGYYDLGKLYNDMGRKEEAVKYFKKAEVMFKEMGMNYYFDKKRKLLEMIQ